MDICIVIKYVKLVHIDVQPFILTNQLLLQGDKISK